jgi:hypothetical protein
MLKNKYRPYLVRFLWISLISLVFTLFFNELVFLLSKDPNDRAPQTVQLVIPAGTAKQIEAGEEIPSIPSEMVFVMGDVLEVVNQDAVSHQLGPVWVPAGSVGRLVMEQPQDLSYSCSFRPSRYLGIDVKLPTTLATRITGLALGMPTMAVLLFLYSVVGFPIKLEDEPAKAAQASKNGKGKPEEADLPGGHGATNGKTV